MPIPPQMPSWLARHLPYRRSVVDVGGLAMHVMEHGPSDGPAVLMVHGNPTWGFLWRKVVDALDGSGLRMVVPDLIGLGFSDKPSSLAVHTLENHSRWMAALVRALDLRDPLVVVQDWGGAIGVGGVVRARASMRGLVVLNTVLGPPKPGFKATPFHRLAQAPFVSDLVFRGLALPPRGMWLAQGQKTSLLGDPARAYRFPLRHRRDRAAPLALARMVPSSMLHPSIPALEAVRDAVEAFEGPAAIVWGERDPVLGKVRRRIERMLPQAKVTTTQAGHFLQEEVPEEIAAAIRDVHARSTAL